MSSKTASKMPECELLYFDLSARAGVPRLLFALAGVEYKNTLISFAEWGASKSDRTRFPLGQMPVLKVGDTYIAESVAINDYLASELGYHGNNNLERARVTMVACCSQGLYSHWAAFSYMEKDPEKCKVLQEKLFNEEAPKVWGYLEGILKQSKEGSAGQKYFVGTEITLADIFFVDIANTLLATKSDTLDNFPCLQKLYNSISQMPVVKEELTTRKLTF